MSRTPHPDGAVLHKLWGLAHDASGYDKADWLMLQAEMRSLRAQLAAADKLSVAERELVDANIAHERATSHATSSRLERAIATLLSVRVKEAT